MKAQETKEKEDNLTRTAGRGALWQIIGGVGTTVIRLGASAVLARALSPDDFGIWGLALLVRELVQQMGALGMTSGLIVKKDVTEQDLNTCFWTMTGIRILLFCITFLVAPLAANFFNNPNVTLVIRAVSVTFLFSIISVVSAALLQKKLYFKQLIIINLICALVESGIAVTLVLYTELQYWALVVGMLVSNLLLSIGIYIIAKWTPRFQFSKESFRYLFHFGINNLGASLSNYLHQNIDYLLVGRMLGTATLGYYQFAYQIPHMIRDRLVQPIGSVVYPALSKVQNNNDELISGFIKTVRYVSLVTFPALGGLAVLAEPIVTILWGEQWLSIIVPLQILCLAAAIRCSMQSLGSIFLCKHRPDIPFKFGFIRLIFTFATVGFLTYLYDLNGVALGMLVSTLPAIIILNMAFKMTESSPLRFWRALREPIVGSCVSMVFAYSTNAVLLLYGLPSWLVLFFAVFSGVAGYVICLRVVYPVLFKEILATISTVMK